MIHVSGRKIFRSRWWALVWAAGICWTAVEVASSVRQPAAPPVDGNAQTTDNSDAPTSDDVNAAVAAFGVK